MKRFAKVMEGVAALVVEALEAPDAPDAPDAPNAPDDGGRWIECGDASAGDRYDEAQGTFHREGAVATPSRPHIVITHIEPDEGNAATTLLAPDWSEVTCREGTRLAVSAELRSGDELLPLTAQFRLPLRATDGRERVLLATMADGCISIGATLRDSGIWRVDEVGINSAMPAGQGFAFSGLTVYVLQD